MLGDGLGPPVRLSLFAGLSNACSNPVAEDVALEFSENGEHPGQCSAAGGGHIECLAEGNEADFER